MAAYIADGVFRSVLDGAVLALTVFPSLFIPKDVAVPDVAGLEYEEAVIKLEDEGFEVDPNAEDIADDKIEEGLTAEDGPCSRRNREGRFNCQAI